MSDLEKKLDEILDRLGKLESKLDGILSQKAGDASSVAQFTQKTNKDIDTYAKKVVEIIKQELKTEEIEEVAFDWLWNKRPDLKLRLSLITREKSSG